jgi:beta-galactosidase
MSVVGRDEFRHYPMQARVGVGRALINANVPFEYVTADDIRAGLAPRYKIIYLPAVLALSTNVLPHLEEYVGGGGRLVMDMPGALYDQYAAVLPTDKGTLLEKTFGVVIRDFQGAGVNVPYKIDGIRLRGFVMDAVPTSARVLATYDGGKPAVTGTYHGKGTAVLLGYEAARACFRPGNERAEAMLLKFTLGGHRPPYACKGALVYRLAAPQADHYFLINDGPATTARLDTKAFAYIKVIDAVSGKPVDPAASVPLPRYSGRWLRCTKAAGR